MQHCKVEKQTLVYFPTSPKLDGCIVWMATIQYLARSARLSVWLSNFRITFSLH